MTTLTLLDPHPHPIAHPDLTFADAGCETLADFIPKANTTDGGDCNHLIPKANTTDGGDCTCRYRLKPTTIAYLSSLLASRSRL
jgi:hypothetical protein